MFKNNFLRKIMVPILCLTMVTSALVEGARQFGRNFGHKISYVDELYKAEKPNGLSKFFSRTFASKVEQQALSEEGIQYAGASIRHHIPIQYYGLVPSFYNSCDLNFDEREPKTTVTNKYHEELSLQEAREQCFKGIGQPYVQTDAEIESGGIGERKLPNDDVRHVFDALGVERTYDSCRESEYRQNLSTINSPGQTQPQETEWKVEEVEVAECTNSGSQQFCVAVAEIKRTTTDDKTDDLPPETEYTATYFQADGPAKVIDTGTMGSPAKEVFFPFLESSFKEASEACHESPEGLPPLEGYKQAFLEGMPVEPIEG